MDRRAPAPFGRFFLPGPTDVHPDVVAALASPVIDPWSSEMGAMLERLQPPLRRAFQTERPVLVGSCPSSGFMEAAIRAAVRHRVLVVVNGARSARFASVAEACGRDVVRVEVPAGRTVEPAHLARFLDGPAVDAVALVHVETSTGALTPLAEVAAAIRERSGVLVLVDGSASVGGIPLETDAWGLDFVFGGSHRALGLPPGLTLGVASERLLERARLLGDRGQTLDVVALHGAARDACPSETPALPLYFALERQLGRIDAEGMPARWARHREMAVMMESWVSRHQDLAIIAAPGRRAATVTALQVPEGEDSRRIAAALGELGWTVGIGVGELEASVIRLGHMGELTPDHLRSLLEALEAVRA